MLLFGYVVCMAFVSAVPLDGASTLGDADAATPIVIAQQQQNRAANKSGRRLALAQCDMFVVSLLSLFFFEILNQLIFPARAPFVQRARNAFYLKK